MTLVQGLNYASALAAFVAAVLWFASARIKTPGKIIASVVKPKWGGPVGEPVGATFMGHVISPDLDALVDALRRQSRWSAYAAGSAALAALFQGLALLMAK